MCLLRKVLFSIQAKSHSSLQTLHQILLACQILTTQRGLMLPVFDFKAALTLPSFTPAVVCDALLALFTQDFLALVYDHQTLLW